MQITRIVPKVTVRICLSGVAAVFVTAHPAVAQESRSMTVLGSIEGTADGAKRDWLTISGEVEGRPCQKNSA